MGWLLRISSDPPLNADDQDQLHAALWDLATTGIAEAPTGEVIAGFETEAEADRAMLALEDRPQLETSVEAVDPYVWSSNTPSADIMLGAVPFTMEVGGAFGHGQHPTTRLANNLVGGALDRDGEGASVLDFGTGTGILALGSLAAGATTVVAVDNDPTARAIARGNIERAIETLGLQSKVSLAIEPDLTTVENTASIDAAGARRFDLVAANVLLVVHREFGRRLAATVKPGGALIISGFVRDQRDEVVALYSDFAIEDEASADDWLALRLRAVVT